MYEVWCCGKPAVMEFGPWNCYQYLVYEDAVIYANKFLGDWAPGELFLSANILDRKYDYNGYGDWIEIRQIPSIL